MGTTNILDLNNRLEKVEKENIAQNSYTSLKNKPKINNVTLTGNKSSADLGLAAASDITGLQAEIGDLASLSTTDKDAIVSAINEVNGNVTDATADSGWLTNNNISYRKIGNYVTVRCEKNIGETTQSWVNAGTLPEGYRPSTTIYNASYTSNATAGIYRITNNGSVDVFGNSANITMNFTVIFPLG